MSAPLPLEDPSAILNSSLNAFKDAIATYLPTLLTWSQRVLSAVVYVGFGYAMIQSWTHRDWMGAFMAFAWSVARIAVIVIALQYFLSWSGGITDVGTAIGTNVSGISANFGPSDVCEIGFTIASQLWLARHFGTWFMHPVDDILFGVLVVGTLIVWFCAGLIYLWVFLDAKWIVAAGIIPVAFSAFEHTYPILENYFSTCLQAGVRLLAVMLVIAVGITLSNGWVMNLNTRGLGVNEDQIGYGMIQLVEAMLLFYAMLSLPKKASQIVTSRSGGGVYEHDSEGAAAMVAMTMSTVTKAAEKGVSKAINAMQGE
jgi:P-type conjugative transfer protein TrbL